MHGTSTTPTYEHAGSILVLLAALAGAVRLLRAGRSAALLCLSALGILAFNFLLHSIWGGDELFLYSQHWQPAMLLLLAGMALPGGKTPRIRTSFLAVLLAVELIWNASLLVDINRVLSL